MRVYRIVILALTILVVVLALNTARLINKERTMKSELEHSELLRNLQKDKLESKLQAMSTQLENYQASVNNTVPHLISQGDIQRFERRGIRNPIETIVGDLLNNHELIPDRMTPKGPFYFHREQKLPAFDGHHKEF